MIMSSSDDVGAFLAEFYAEAIPPSSAASDDMSTATTRAAVLHAWQHLCRGGSSSSSNSSSNLLISTVESLLMALACDTEAVRRELTSAMAGRGGEEVDRVLGLEALAAAASHHVLKHQYCVRHHTTEYGAEEEDEGEGEDANAAPVPLPNTTSSNPSDSKLIDAVTTLDVVLQHRDNAAIPCMSTGCDGIDAILGTAGFRCGWVWEVYGEAGSGKTQLVVQCMLTQLSLFVASDTVPELHDVMINNTDANSSHARVSLGSPCCVYLVSEDVPSARLAPIATGCIQRVMAAYKPLVARYLPPCEAKAALQKLHNALTVRAVLNLLLVKEVSSLSALDGVLSSGMLTTAAANAQRRGRRHAMRAGKAEGSGGGCGGGVVVLDSIAAAAMQSAADYNNSPYSQTTALHRVGHELRRLAYDLSLAVLVVNQVRCVPPSARQRSVIQRRFGIAATTNSTNNNSDQLWVPALGLPWAQVPHGRLCLSKHSTSSTTAAGVGDGVSYRRAVMLGSSCVPPGSANYIITDTGIESH